MNGHGAEFEIASPFLPNEFVQDSVDESKLLTRWCYRGEGNRCLVVADVQQRTVFRLVKRPCKKKHRLTTPEEYFKADSERIHCQLQRIADYMTNVMMPLLSEYYVISPRLITIPEGYLSAVGKAIEQNRPEHRKIKELDPACHNALVLPDFCFVREGVQRRRINNTNPPTISVEIKIQIYHQQLPLKILQKAGQAACSKDCQLLIPSLRIKVHLRIKPKKGFLPLAHQICPEKNLKLTVCQFCMHQKLKLKRGKWPKTSSYCPVDLFSGCPARMKHALLCLLTTPQNNLRICKNGVEIFGEVIQSDLPSCLKDFLAHHGTRNGYSNYTHLHHFLDLIVKVLLWSPVLDSPVTSELESVTQAHCNVDSRSSLNNNTPNGSVKHCANSGICNSMDYSLAKRENLACAIDCNSNLSKITGPDSSTSEDGKLKSSSTGSIPCRENMTENTTSSISQHSQSLISPRDEKEINHIYNGSGSSFAAQTPSITTNNHIRPGRSKTDFSEHGPVATLSHACDCEELKSLTRNIADGSDKFNNVPVCVHDQALNGNLASPADLYPVTADKESPKSTPNQLPVDGHNDQAVNCIVTSLGTSGTVRTCAVDNHTGSKGWTVFNENDARIQMSNPINQCLSYLPISDIDHPSECDEFTRKSLFINKPSSSQSQNQYQPLSCSDQVKPNSQLTTMPDLSSPLSSSVSLHRQTELLHRCVNCHDNDESSDTNLNMTIHALGNCSTCDSLREQVDKLLICKNDKDGDRLTFLNTTSQSAAIQRSISNSQQVPIEQRNNASDSRDGSAVKTERTHYCNCLNSSIIPEHWNYCQTNVVQSCLLMSSSNRNSAISRHVKIGTDLPEPVWCANSSFSPKSGKAASLPYGCVMERILHLQRLDSVDVEEIYPLYQQLRLHLEKCKTARASWCLEGPYTTEQWHTNSAGVYSSRLEKGGLDYSLQKVKEFLMSKTVQDCSIMLCIQPMKDSIDIGTTSPGEHIIHDEFGHCYRFSIGIIDLDPKPFDKIPLYYQNDTMIVEAYQESLHAHG